MAACRPESRGIGQRFPRPLSSDLSNDPTKPSEFDPEDTMTENPPTGKQPDWYRPASGRPAMSVPGNAAAVTHGAYSERVFGEQAKRLRAWAVEQFPDLDNPRYWPELDAWAAAEAQAELLRRAASGTNLVKAGGPDDGFVVVPNEPILRALQSVENRAAKHRAALGMNPRAHASLTTERAEAMVYSYDASEIAARGAEALARRGLLPAAERAQTDDAPDAHTVPGAEHDTDDSEN
jgi:hypothetical protein